MAPGDGDGFRPSARPEDTGRQLKARGNDEALLQIGLELCRGLHARDFDAAVYWLIAYASFAGVEPSPQARSLLARFLARQVRGGDERGREEPSRGQKDGSA